GEADPLLLTQRLRQFVGDQHLAPAPTVLRPLRGERRRGIGRALTVCVQLGGHARGHLLGPRRPGRNGGRLRPRILAPDAGARPCSQGDQPDSYPRDWLHGSLLLPTRLVRGPCFSVTGVPRNGPTGHSPRGQGPYHATDRTAERGVGRRKGSAGREKMPPLAYRNPTARCRFFYPGRHRWRLSPAPRGPAEALGHGWAAGPRSGARVDVLYSDSDPWRLARGPPSATLAIVHAGCQALGEPGRGPRRCASARRWSSGSSAP